MFLPLSEKDLLTFVIEITVLFYRLSFFIKFITYILANKSFICYIQID